MWLPPSFVVLLFAVWASGAITNTTFDDSDPSFAFVGGWTAITPASPCDFCASKPDASQTYQGTWHDGSGGDSGSFTFLGSAIYIFGIDQAGVQPNLGFTLGGVTSAHQYTGTEHFVYNALFFSATGLPSDQTHTVKWVANSNPGSGVALFDYAIVTTGESEDVASSATAPGAPSRSGSTKSPTSSTGTLKSTGSSTMTSAVGTDRSTSAASQLTPIRSPEGQSSTDIPSSTDHPTSSSTNTGSAAVTPQSASSHSESIGAIIGGVIGAFFAALATFFIWLRCRRVHRQRTGTYDSTARPQSLTIEHYPFHTTQNTLSVPGTCKGGHVASLDRFIFRKQRLNTTTIPIPTHPGTLPQIEPPVSINPAPTISTTSRNFRLLEERLATLEAQVAVNQHPPPYVPEDDD